MFRAVKQLPPSLRNSGRQLLTIAKAGTSYNLELQTNNLVQAACKTTPTRLCSTKTPESMTTLAGAAKAARLNRLADEKSTYLLQHAANPVDWFPWGDEAFQKAKNENKLIFLSVGYSTCHWCHVMERESFESEVIAEILNENYVCIKVDREERPDVDRIYMSFVQRTTGGGGWPMSVFLTPNLAPLYGGTYFPPEDNFGRVGFKNLIRLIAQQWEKERATLQKEASESVVQLKKVVASKFATAEDIPSEESWQKCFQQILRSYEVKWGGFSRAPKFPQPSMMSFLFKFYYQNKKTYDGTKAKEMCLHTLERMAYGGIHDHVNSGFARYSVDAEWHLPHFEKMLYDQSQLVNAYLDAFIISKDNFYKDVVDDIITYVCRDLSHFEGGFFGAEDADSYPSSDRTGGKKEGAFCVWEYKALKNLLTEQVDGISEFEVYAHHFNAKPEGNVRPEYDRHAELTHKNVLSCSGSYKETADVFKLTEEKVKEILSRCNAKLYENRQNRPKPHVDTKIVTSWNGLMISGLARAGFYLKTEKYTERAIKAANFVKQHLYKDNKLFRCCYGDETSVSEKELPILGFLDDYVCMIKGLLDLYESTLDTTWLEWAEDLQKVQDDDFWDTTNNGYFSSSYNDETIVIRDKEDQDGAEPCGNSLAVTNLIRLSGYLHRNDLRKKAALILRAFAEHLNKIPIALPEMGAALILYHSEPLQIFIVGKPEEEDTQKLLDVLRSIYIPGKIVALADGPDGGAKLLYARNKSLSKLRLVDGRSAAYVCRNFACSFPVTDPAALQASLETVSKRATRSDSSSSSDSN